ncbi:MAG: zinc ABC transporter substrate-binding protein, partial [Candidatus Omnitrophica bacterium]|nr:zinc ABC transporter substrate-binding protein [Candidatus Omnitrophota bacterium]
DFARLIVGDRVDVPLLLPPGVEPHSFESTPKDITRILHADVFVYTGPAMEPWVSGILEGLKTSPERIVNASEGIAFRDAEGVDDEAEAEPGPHEGPDHAHAHGRDGMDPHVWLDFENDQRIVESIAAALIKADPSGADFYLQNASRLSDELADLDRRYRDTLSDCDSRTVIYAGHFAFGYLAHRYELEFVSPYEGFSPNAELAPRAVVELIRRIRISGASCVFTEELAQPRLARVIAEEAGVPIERLHDGHNVSKADLERGVGFLDLMERNLRKLAEGLQCRNH